MGVMWNSMKVSIIVPVYNSEKTIERCIQSVLAQSYTDYELILVNDGSLDSSLTICRKYAAEDERIIIIEKTNGGVSSARNIGIKKSSGEYIFFLDGDDSIEKETLSKYVELSQSGAVDVVIGSLRFVYQNGKTKCRGFDGTEYLKTDDLWEKICINSEPFGWAGGKMVHTEIVKQNNLLFDEDMLSQEDLEFFLRVYDHGKCFCITEYAGYDYYFVDNKREPNVPDYISNQLALISTAQTHGKVSRGAKNKVDHRIALLIYTFLYGANTKKEFLRAVMRLKKISKLEEYYQSMDITGSKKRILKWYFKEKYIKTYYYCRLKKIAHFFRSSLKEGIRFKG